MNNMLFLLWSGAVQLIHVENFDEKLSAEETYVYEKRITNETC